MFCPVCQMAAPVGRQTTLFGPVRNLAAIAGAKSVVSDCILFLMISHSLSFRHEKYINSFLGFIFVLFILAFVYNFVCKVSRVSRPICKFSLSDIFIRALYKDCYWICWLYFLFSFHCSNSNHNFMRIMFSCVWQLLLKNSMMMMMMMMLNF